jgi:DNA-binding transcriptional regulator LsrR (DeoR family)
MNMRKIIDDQRMIYKCCSLYYEDNMGQLQIAQYLGISKSSVSRMLQLGRELGIVEIKVHHVSQYMYEDLERDLIKKFHLRDVIVAESSPLDTREERISKLNERAADYLNRLIKDGDYVGLSLGSTLRNIAHTTLECTKRDCTFVPIVGGVGKGEVQAGQVSEAFAKKFGGKAIPFFSPAIFSNEALMNEFLKEDSVRYIFDYFKKLNIVISGINSSSVNHLTVEKLGFVSKELAKEYYDRGAVCNIVLRFLDIEGNVQEFDDYNQRIAAISMEEYRNVEYKILVTGGKGNADTIRASVNGGYANIVITDVDCARELLS